jgi:hypothetical protein
MSVRLADGNDSLRIALLAVVLVALAASAIAPFDRTIWLAEVLPVLIALPILLATARRFPLTPLCCGLIALFALILILGGTYTYARVPLGFWLQHMFDFARNPYDRIGHFFQGVTPAILGRELLLRGHIDSTQLLQALAEQLDEPWAPLNPFKLDKARIQAFPRHLALRYAVLPVDEDGQTLILDSERQVSQVSLGAISRQLERPVRYRLAPQGRVTVGLRYWYGGKRLNEETRTVLEILERRQDDDALLERICIRQVLFGDRLQVRGILPSALFNQALIDFDPERQSLGQHLLERGMIDQTVLDDALRQQAAEQHESYLLDKEAE